MSSTLFGEMWAFRLYSQWGWVLHLTLRTTEHRAQWAGILEMEACRKAANHRAVRLFFSSVAYLHTFSGNTFHICRQWPHPPNAFCWLFLLYLPLPSSSNWPLTWVGFFFFFRINTTALSFDFSRTPRCLLYNARKSGSRLLLFLSNASSFMLLHYKCCLYILS